MGDGHTKNLRPRKVIERNTEKRGAPTDSKGTAQEETDPHTGIGRKKDGEAADRFGHKEQRLFRASDGSHGKRKCIFRGNGRGLLRRRSHRFLYYG